MECYLVPPFRPTSFEGTIQTVDLPGYELWFTFIKIVYVLPDILDANAFICALSKSLQVYPHAAGRLRREGDIWQIKLTNSPVPLEVVSDTSVGFDGCPFVVVDDLSPFLSLHPSGVPVYNEDTPLLRLKLTFGCDETVMGVSWNHTLGDATVLLRFMQRLSQSYQGLDVFHPLPTFDKYRFSAPTSNQLERMLPLMPHLADMCHSSELGEKYAEMNRSIVPIKFRFDGEKLASLHLAVESIQGQRLSMQDCITAFIVSTLNKCLDTPIIKVTNAASYRRDTFVDPNVAGNSVYIVLCREFKISNMSTIATTIRESIEGSRNESFIKDWMSVASHLMLKAANSDKLHFFGCMPSTLNVNSNFSLDWRSPHFGFPESIRFFTSGVSNQYLRVFRSNPRRTNDGTWISAGTSVDVCLGVRSDIAENFLNTLQTCIDPYGSH